MDFSKMDAKEQMARSEAVEVVLKNGHVAYGKVVGFTEDDNMVMRDSNGDVLLVDLGEISLVKLVGADPEISKLIDQTYGKRPTPPRVVVKGVSLASIMEPTVVVDESIKVKHSEVEFSPKPEQRFRPAIAFDEPKNRTPEGE